MIRLVIEKMSKGGFVVYDGDGLGESNGYFCRPIHAATDIADALGFIGDNLAPVEKALGATIGSGGAVPLAYCTADASSWCASLAAGDRCKGCPHMPLRGETSPDPGCSVCGSLHADAYCARQTCPGKHRKLYEPAADGSVNWAG